MIHNLLSAFGLGILATLVVTAVVLVTVAICRTDKGDTQ
jgi:hypothetical protein